MKNKKEKVNANITGRIEKEGKKKRNVPKKKKKFKEGEEEEHKVE